MCDKKYMDEKKGMDNIENFLKNEMYLDNIEIETILKIISTMSYSKVKKNGFPDDLGIYILAYHVVREADLLTAYSFIRCLEYTINNIDENFESSIERCKILFNERMFKHFDDGLFKTKYSLKKWKKLHNNTIEEINYLDKIVKLINIKKNNLQKNKINIQDNLQKKKINIQDNLQENKININNNYLLFIFLGGIFLFLLMNTLLSWIKIIRLLLL
jgi:hypothetical protein